MITSIKAAILLFFITISTINSKPKVDLYIESLCPDCMQFLTTSYANFLKQTDHMDLADVTIYPYGNASEKEQAGKYTFTCQHGPNECYGNLYYECANVFFGKKFGNTQRAHEFIVCMEGNIIVHGRNFDVAAYHCLLGDEDLLSMVQLCVQDPNVSYPLMHKVAQATDALEPKHDHVPWIVVDGKWNLDVENKIIADMYAYFKNTDKNIR